MQTLKVDIINDKALNLLKNLELLGLIRLHDANKENPIGSAAQYKGAISKQPLDKVNNQLHQLRNA